MPSAADIEFLKIAGPWMLVLLFVLRETLPAFLKRQRDTETRSWRIEEEERDRLVQVYEKFISLQAENIKFIAGATEALRDVSEGLADVRQALQEMVLEMRREHI
ncbi:MAG: hypothetical protein ACE5FD_03825 [Anaerolineae bacterium]